MKTTLSLIAIAWCLLGAGCGTKVNLGDSDVDNIVRRAYPYVALYNVNNEFAIKQGCWNTVAADTRLKDHTTREIARPNNDTLYISCMLDLRKDTAILEIPAFDSKYVSLMITAYDHYVNVPMATRLGDFGQPERMLVYSERTEGYDGGTVDGVDRYFETSGDFVSAVLRIMPHANDPDRFARIVEQMNGVRPLTLAEYRGGEAKAIDDIPFPEVGRTDADIFANNFLEVMQFVFNHTTFDRGDPLDQAALAAFEQLGVVPGRAFDATRVAEIDGGRFRTVAGGIAAAEMANALDPAYKEQNVLALFQPKGRMTLENLVFQSVIGPIGLPVAEAAYPMIVTTDGQPMNATGHYVIRMTGQQMPPTGAFWSVTLYDSKNGFFIPDDGHKYSVGENSGMALAASEGIEIHIAPTRPEGVPVENWLPSGGKDEQVDAAMRLYVPDLAALRAWTAPSAEKL